MPKRVVVGLLLLAILAVIGGVGWLNNKSTAVKVGPEVGYKAPDFSLSGLDGKKVKLSSVVRKNRLTVVNFWGIWCPYCVKEIPELAKFYDKYAGSQVELLGINVGDDPKIVPEFAQKNGMKFPNLFDSGNKVTYLYQVRGFLTTFLIDQKGIIRDMIIGATSFPALDQKAQKVLKEN